MALAGKAAGKGVGLWFGPCAAAEAVRILVDGSPSGPSLPLTEPSTRTRFSPPHTPPPTS
ncbi:hypothetical protein C8R44DRAFT_817974 [Mycena epipterygia]|nr:hypothetical protein C8R44DRAFT_817974 [Mycena epipterygia]